MTSGIAVIISCNRCVMKNVLAVYTMGVVNILTGTIQKLFKGYKVS